MKKYLIFFTLFMLMAGLFFGKTTITYWQYFYQTKKEVIDELIMDFEKLNPDIKVEHVTFPYENYNQKVAASVPAGIGPDVINLYYGWLPLYVLSGYLQPLPENDFSAEYFQDNFFGFVPSGVEFQGKYYAVPDRKSVV